MNDGSETARAIALNQELYLRRKEYFQSGEEVIPVDDFRYRFPSFSAERGGLCGHRANLMVNTLRSHGIPARILLIGIEPEKNIVSHVICEVYLEKKWRVFDPLFGFHYINRAGELATIEEMKSLESITRVETESPDRSGRYPAIGRYPEIYHFREHAHFNWLKTPLSRALADLWPGLRYFTPPSFMDHRQPFFLLASLCLLLSSLLLGLRFYLSSDQKCSTESGVHPDDVLIRVGTVRHSSRKENP